MLPMLICSTLVTPLLKSMLKKLLLKHSMHLVKR